ncbi:Helix domain-containing protein [Desulfonema magnum]|uniref:Probable pectate lyase C n=2 Tax=Desulfonema magnum TaxID=45655 RepID=A0A975BZ51_9BACT|nr:Helix domain-containing protein [Desulfonema magnum]
MKKGKQLFKNGVLDVIIVVCMLTVLGLALPGIAHAETVISGGSLSGDTTWTKSGSPYRLTGDVTVPKDLTLTIQPGVVVNMDAYVDLNINGGFIAEGTTDAPITFQWSTEGEHWGGIEFGSSSLPGNTLSHCRLIGGGYGVISIENSISEIRNNLIEQSSCGIYIGSGSPLIENNLIIDNSGPGIRIRYSSSTPSIRFNTIDSNYDGIYSDSAPVGGVIENNIISNNRYGIRNAGENVRISHNNVWNNVTDYSSSGAVSDTDLSADPLFVNYYLGEDHHVTDGSPCKNTDVTGGEIGAYGNGGSPPPSERIYSPVPTTSGNLTHNERWSGTVNLTGDLTVPHPFTLTIEPGTIVNLSDGADIIVQSRFFAQGTDTSPIVFQWTTEGEHWGHIEFNASSLPENVLSHCRLIGGGHGAVSVKNSISEIRNNLIEQCYGGIFIDSGSPLIENNLIIDNSVYGIRIRYSSCTPSIRFNTIDSNYDGICSDSAPVDGVIENNIITNNFYGIRGVGESVLITHNNVWHNTTDYSSSGAIPNTDLSADPLFVNYYLGEDHHVTDGSPCKNTDVTGGEIGAYGNGGSPPPSERIYSPVPTTSGNLTHNERWSGTVNLTGDLTVPHPFTLTIEPGTIVNLSDGADIIVQSRFFAQGTDTSPIVFQWTTEGEHWGHIEFNASSLPENVLSHCRLIGGGHGAVSVKNSISEIRNNLIEQCYGGIFIDSGSPLIENNLIIDNSVYGIRIRYSSCTPSIRFNTIDSNYDGICSDSAPVDGVIENNIITNNFYGIRGVGESVLITHNNVWHNTTDYSSSGAIPNTDLSADPLFVNYYLGEDHHVTDGSPCKNTDVTGGEIGAYGNGGSPPPSERIYSPVPTTSGNLTHNERWSGTVNLTGDLTVPHPFTLTIEPGTIVNLSDGADIIVQSRFFAQGTDTSPIVFQWTTEGEHWGHIEFNASSLPENVLSHCRLIGGGHGAVSVKNSISEIRNNLIEQCYGGIFIDSGSPLIENNLIIDNSVYGIRIRYSSSSPSIRFNTIDYSNSYGISFDSAAASGVIENNIITNNRCGIRDAGENVQTGYNNVWNNGYINNDDEFIERNYYNTTASATDTSTAPQYIDDLRHLSSSSPCKTASSEGGEIGAYGQSASLPDNPSDTPTIAQWPMEAPPGTRFTQWGTGFTSNSTVTLHFQKPGGTEYPVQTADTDASGKFVVTYNAPLDKPVGTYIWWAIDDTTGEKSNQISYIITEHAVPTIAQWPMSGPPGTEFEQWGTGFTPNSTATLRFQKPDGTEYAPMTVSVDGSGKFKTRYAAPWDKPMGTYTWWAVDGVTGNQCVALKYEITAGTSGELGGFTVTQNSGEISDQQINTPFEVEITARDKAGNILTGFNGTALLASNSGTVYPTPNVNIVNGKANLSIYLSNQGKTRLSCSGYGKYGYSSFFSVEGEKICKSTLKGRIVDTRGDAVWNAVVSLYEYEGQEISKVYWTDENGEFRMNNLNCGTYELRVEKNEEKVEKSVFVTNLPRNEAYIELPLNGGNSGTPVILIPGIMGSNCGSGLIYPKLPAQCPAPYLRIHRPRFLGWKDLKYYFSSSGFYVFECPWDWRLECDEAYQHYLIPKIREALEKSTTGKVHVIAHSMGGLVARAYIQSSDYNDDIDKFVMVGTPNTGSANPYYIWEGGNPKGIDDITDWRPFLNIYSNTIQKLWEETYYEKEPWSNRNHRKIRAFVRRVSPSLRQLMNTTDFLTDGDTTWGVSTEGNENTWLKELNDDPNIRDLMSSDGSDGTVHVKLFVGKKADNTVEMVRTYKRSFPWFKNALYEDGRPGILLKKSLTWGEGDGTVPYESASFPYDEGWADMSITFSSESHANLISDDKFVEEIFTFLLGDSGKRRVRELRELREDEDAADSLLSVSITGDMRLCVTDPEGRKTGIAPETIDFIEEIPNAESVFTSDGGSVSIKNPDDGLYTVTFFGESEKDFHLNAGFTDGEKTSFIKLKGYCPDTPGSFKIFFNHSASPRITLLPSVQVPKGLQADLVSSGSSSLTRLSWNASAEEDITGYNVYSAGENEPYFVKIAALNGSETTFDTNDAWSDKSSTEVKTYAVTAVRSDGSESFFSERVQNNDRDHDGLSDEEESSYGTEISNSDTDGDGLNDGGEYYYGTDPLKTDTDNDDYDDYREIRSGSDPLDENSVPVKGDINGDGDVTLADIVVTLQALAALEASAEVCAENDVSGDEKVGLEEAIWLMKQMTK